MSFEIAYNRTAKIEGGWADDPADRGGKTNRGVTEATWINYWRRRGILPSPVRLGGVVRWRGDVIDRWARAREEVS